MMITINLTLDPATVEQGEAGVIGLPSQEEEELKRLLTFTAPPSRSAIAARARLIARLASWPGVTAAMIGGPSYLMGPLETALRERGIAPLHAFVAERSVKATDLATGEAWETNVSCHLGFVEA